MPAPCGRGWSGPPHDGRAGQQLMNRSAGQHGCWWSVCRCWRPDRGCWRIGAAPHRADGPVWIGGQIGGARAGDTGVAGGRRVRVLVGGLAVVSSGFLVAARGLVAARVGGCALRCWPVSSGVARGRDGTGSLTFAEPPGYSDRIFLWTLRTACAPDPLSAGLTGHQRSNSRVACRRFWWPVVCGGREPEPLKPHDCTAARLLGAPPTGSGTPTTSPGGEPIPRWPVTSLPSVTASDMKEVER
jgi:hypothetical protein